MIALICIELVIIVALAFYCHLLKKQMLHLKIETDAAIMKEHKQRLRLSINGQELCNVTLFLLRNTMLQNGQNPDLIKLDINADTALRASRVSAERLMNPQIDPRDSENT